MSESSTQEHAENSNVPPQLRPYLFKPGQSGNPGGRPKGRTLAGRLRELLDEVDKDGNSWKEKVIAALLMSASSGDVRAIREVFDRIDGKVRAEETADDPLVVAELLREKYAPEDE